MGNRRATLFALVLMTVTAVPASAGAAVPDEWARWTNLPDEGVRVERDAWVRSLDIVDSKLYASSEGDGVFTSPTAIGPWSGFNSGLGSLSARSVRQVASAGGRLYAATNAGLFTALPAGPWTPLLNTGGIEAVHPNSATDLVVGGASLGILYSADSGAHWAKASGMPTGETVFSIAPAPGILYAAAASGVFKSVDQGRSWVLATDGIPPSVTVRRVAVTPGDANLLYAATTKGVYRSVNAGSTWNAANGALGATLGNEQVRALLALPAAFGSGRVVAGTEAGAWATRDGGGSWGQMSPETLIDPDPADPAPDPLPFGQQTLWSFGAGFGSPGSLMAGTRSSGAYALPLQPLENTAGPTITPSSGLNAGERLTASAGAWAGTRPGFFSYQWRRCAADGTGCVPIAGAVGPKYALSVDDVGHRVSVLVTARNVVPPDPAGVSATPVPAAGTVTAESATAPFPVNPASFPTLTPSSGTHAWGQVFTINNGSWRTTADASVSPSFTYHWQRCNSTGVNCSTIPAAEGQARAATIADVGGKISAYITATYQGASATRLVGQTQTIAERTPVNADAPRIVGDALVGRRLSSSAGAWTANDPSFQRRWLRCGADGLGCTPIAPAQTGSAFTPTAADLGRRVRVEVTATVAGSSQTFSATALSAPSAVIANAPVGPPAGPAPIVTPRTIAKPKIRIKRPRRLRLGSKLSVPAKIKGFTKLRYRWYRSGKKIKRATKRVYRLTRKDRRKKLHCRVTLTPVAGGKAIVVKSNTLRIPRRLTR
jgi:hypothetical protein